MVVPDKLKSLRGEGSLEIIARLRGRGARFSLSTGLMEFREFHLKVNRVFPPCNIPRRAFNYSQKRSP